MVLSCILKMFRPHSRFNHGLGDVKGPGPRSMSESVCEMGCGRVGTADRRAGAENPGRVCVADYNTRHISGCRKLFGRPQPAFEPTASHVLMSFPIFERFAEFRKSLFSWASIVSFRSLRRA